MRYPSTADIFAASRQEDIILQLCKVMTLGAPIERRQFTLRIMQPSFAALRWLNEERFKASSVIEATLHELQASAEKLASMDPSEEIVENDGRPMTCPVCRELTQQPNKYEHTIYCRKCLDVILPSLSKLRSRESGFGTDAI